MSYFPNATVQIDGTDFSSNTLAGVSITYGRNTVWEQARSSYAQISIYVPNNADNSFEINHSVVVKIENSSGVDKTIFTGKLVSVQNTVQATGSSGEVCIQTITAVGPFAAMSRTITGTSNFPKEMDDERLDRIITASGVTKDVIDTPGIYEFHSRANSPSDCYTLAASYANMVFGYIYETPAGSVGYANESRRLNEVQDNGYFGIPENCILAAGIQSFVGRQDITNDIILSYKDNNSVAVSDSVSISNYGRSASSISTELETLDDATDIANRYLLLRSQPTTSLSEFHIELGNGNLTNAKRNSLIDVYMGLPIEITGLPIPIFLTTYRGFVEGWTWNISRTNARLTVRTSESSLSLPETRWQDVSATQKWTDVGATITWTQYE
jgi:hypothetical protein